LFNKNYTNSRNDYTEDDIIKMMEYIYLLKGYTILNNLAGIPSGIPDTTDIL
jgi:hypothetical protein